MANKTTMLLILSASILSLVSIVSGPGLAQLTYGQVDDMTTPKPKDGQTLKPPTLVPKLSSLAKYSLVKVPSNGYGETVARCQDDQLVTGGGFVQIAGVMGSSHIVASGPYYSINDPLSETNTQNMPPFSGWQFKAHGQGGDKLDSQFQVYAICSKIIFSTK